MPDLYQLTLADLDAAIGRAATLLACHTRCPPTRSRTALQLFRPSPSASRTTLTPCSWANPVSGSGTVVQIPWVLDPAGSSDTTQVVAGATNAFLHFVNPGRYQLNFRCQFAKPVTSYQDGHPGTTTRTSSRAGTPCPPGRSSARSCIPGTGSTSPVPGAGAHQLRQVHRVQRHHSPAPPRHEAVTQVARRPTYNPRHASVRWRAHQRRRITMSDTPATPEPERQDGDEVRSSGYANKGTGRDPAGEHRRRQGRGEHGARSRAGARRGRRRRHRARRRPAGPGPREVTACSPCSPMGSSTCTQATASPSPTSGWRATCWSPTPRTGSAGSRGSTTSPTSTTGSRAMRTLPSGTPSLDAWGDRPAVVSRGLPAPAPAGTKQVRCGRNPPDTGFHGVIAAPARLGRPSTSSAGSRCVRPSACRSSRRAGPAGLRRPPPSHQADRAHGAAHQLSAHPGRSSTRSPGPGRRCSRPATAAATRSASEIEQRYADLAASRPRQQAFDFEVLG